MTIKELIYDKDYDNIVIRVTPPEGCDEESILFGCCKSEDGKLISLDDDTYYEGDEVLEFEEWEDGSKSGLTVVLKGEWI